MTNERKQFDLLRISGLRRKKPSERDLKYATLHRRLMAATIDSLLLALFLGPLLDVAINNWHPAPPLDWAVVEQRIREHPGDREATRQILAEAFEESDVINRTSTNFLLQTGIFFLYSGICWHFWSATPGKMLMRMKVVDAKTEGKLSRKQIIDRLFGYLISGLGLGIGFMWVRFDKKRQGWHDKLADTIVIKTKSK